ncbi:hypothetical protein H2248_008457 [Termitomyces sp. 'cryptogamus']|nr:hypothetical protein H2248_008457 [Termitomyces sp. 'cryptogamus']
MVAWIFYTISRLLILGHQTGSEPPYGTCLAQAVSVYATPPLCGLSHTCLVIDYYILSSSLTFRKKLPGDWIFRMLLVFPWVIFVLLTYITMLFVAEPSVLIRNGDHFYCVLSTQTMFLVCAVIIFVACMVNTALLTHTAITLHRHWGVFRMSSSNNAHLSLSMFLRLSIFTSLTFLTLGLTIFAVYGLGTHTAAWATISVAIPILPALVYGTQRDILRTFLFWRKQDLHDSKSSASHYKDDSKDDQKSLQRMSIR